jgi:hypothetical protein
MESGDERFESYLREFEPRRPRALIPVDRRLKWRRWAAAAAVVIAMGGSTWFAVQQRRSRRSEGGITKATSPQTEFGLQRLSILSLTQTALQDPVRLDAELTKESRRVLPDFRGKESTLRVLAKE